jgi:hypothetical protein
MFARMNGDADALLECGYWLLETVKRDLIEHMHLNGKGEPRGGKIH